MGTRTAREALRDSVKSLLRHNFGEAGVTIGRLRRETGIGAGGASAILKGGADARISTVEKIAKRFRYEAWQLLLPDFKPDPKPLSDSERDELERLLKVVDELSPAQRDALVDSEGIKRLVTGPHFPVEKMRGQWDASSKRKR